MEGASVRTAAKEGATSRLAGGKRGYIATGVVRARPCEERRGEERARENSNIDRFSLSMASGDPTSRGRRGALGSEGLATEDGSGGSWDGGGQALH